MRRGIRRVLRAAAMGAAAFTLLLAFNLTRQGLAAPAGQAAPVAAAIAVIAPVMDAPALRGPYD